MASGSDPSADDLILQMQHLAAAAKAGQAAHAQEGRTTRLRTKAQQMAAAAQTEVDHAERDQKAAEEKLAQAREPGRAPLEAADLFTAGRALAADAKTRLVKARARLNFALDQMDEADRRDYQTLQLEAAAEAHAQLAESGDDSSRMPVLPAGPAPAPAAATSGGGGGSGTDGA
jgi:exonuclease VII small subunit